MQFYYSAQCQIASDRIGDISASGIIANTCDGCNLSLAGSLTVLTYGYSVIGILCQNLII